MVLGKIHKIGFDDYQNESIMQLELVVIRMLLNGIPERDIAKLSLLNLDFLIETKANIEKDKLNGK